MHAARADARTAEAVVRGAALRVAAFAVGAGTSLVAAAVLLRHLGAEDAGRYFAVLALVAIAGGVTDAGLATIGVREHTALPDDDERRAMLAELLGLRLVLSLAGVAGAVLFAAVAGYSGALVAGAAIAGAGLVAQAGQGVAAVPLVAQMRLGTAAACDLVRQATSSLATVLLVVAGAGLVSLFLAPVAGGVAALAATLAVLARQRPPRPTLRLGRVAGRLREVGAYAAAAAVAAIYFRLAIVLVSLVGTAQETGYFAAAFRGVEVLIVLPQLLVGAAFPALVGAAEGGHGRLSAAVGRVVDVCVILGVGLALLLAAGADVVIDVVAGAGFEPAADVLRIQGLGLAASFTAAGWSYAALSLRLHREILVASLVALAVVAALVLALAPAHGAAGAAVGTTIAELVLAAGMGLAVRRAGVSLTGDLRLARVVAAGALAALPLLALDLGGVGATALCAALYVGALAALRAMPPMLRLS